MPSFAFVSTFALALLSAAPALAGSPINSPVLGKRQAAPRGRPNHADLYGYPHGRGDHSGTRGPAPAVNKPMTPGGYVDPRPANPGATCRYNSQCSTGIRNARAVCGASGTCSYQCLGATVFDGTSCAGQIVAPRCSFDRQCPTSVANAAGKCVAGRCSFACNDGFYAQGSTCATADKTCGDETCPVTPGGYSICENGRCSTKCEGHLGFQMYCNADRSVCQCINTANDINNCGTPGNVCPPSYNGKGRAYCAAGVCGLSCYRLTKLTPRDGAPYCT